MEVSKTKSDVTVGPILTVLLEAVTFLKKNNRVILQKKASGPIKQLARTRKKVYTFCESSVK